jgi:hypothetical protein
LKKCLSWLIIFVTFSLSPLLSQNVEQYTVKKVQSKITVDGRLDEQVWDLAKATKEFVVLGSSQKAKSMATAKMLWDDTFLYIGFYCQDAKIWATFTDRDDPLYQEDVVEVYIDPDGDGNNYLEIEVNPLNTIFDLWLTKPWADGGKGNTAWTMAGLETAIVISGTVAQNSDEDSAWFCEMAMPFSEMQFAAPSRHFPPVENDRWRFNLYRFDRSSTSGSVGEATGWSQTNGGQHEPDKFGVITFGGLMTDVFADQSIKNVEDFILGQNYPNPFNPSTTIQFSIPAAGHVSLVVYDMLGQKIETLLNGHHQKGSHNVTWTADDLPSGVYLYQLVSGSLSETKKFVLQK